MKKLSIALVMAITLVASAVPAYAHGGHHGRATSSSNYTYYATCAVRDCSQAGLHNHGGRTYSAHYYGDGHGYHGHYNHGY